MTNLTNKLLRRPKNHTLAERSIRYHEGLRLHPYFCTAGKLTIGWGRNLEDRGLTQEEADFIFDTDWKRVKAELQSALPWTDQLDAVRYAVLADMCFNLGLPKFLAFKQTLEAVKQGDYARAASRMLASLWATQVPDRAKRLAAMMATGTVPPELS